MKSSSDDRRSDELRSAVQADPATRPQDFLAVVIDALNHPFYVVNADDYTIEMGNTASGVKEAIGAKCHVLMHHSAVPCGRLEPSCPVDEVRRAGKPIVVEHYHYDDTGRKRCTEVHAHPLCDAQNKVARVIVYALDVTDRKDAEQRLKALNETLELRVAQRTLEAQQRAQQLRRLALELTQAEHRERQRLARILHDDLQQLLLGIRLNVASLRSRVADSLRSAQFQEIDQTLGEAIEVSRSLSVELEPPILRAAGLAAALTGLARQMQDKFGLTVEVAADEAANPRDDHLATLLYQSVRELLFNVIKHAQVKEAALRMNGGAEGRLEIVVEDRGVGFDLAQVRQQPQGLGSFGLDSIRERLELLGGRMQIDAALGKGTRVTFLVSCDAGAV